jgi:hypothetical protein
MSGFRPWKLVEVGLDIDVKLVERQEKPAVSRKVLLPSSKPAATTPKRREHGPELIVEGACWLSLTKGHVMAFSFV